MPFVAQLVSVAFCCDVVNLVNPICCIFNMHRICCYIVLTLQPKCDYHFPCDYSCHSVKIYAQKFKGVEIFVQLVSSFFCCFQEPFSHESLLLDQQDQRLTKREKRLAQQGYEMDKKMANRPSYYPRPLVGGMPINVR